MCDDTIGRLTLQINKKTNPNPKPVSEGFGFLLFGMNVYDRYKKCECS